MNDDDFKWLVRIYEGLLQAGACFDCMTPFDGEPSTVPEAELLEAVNSDVSRAYSAIERILAKHNRLPEWASKSV